MADITLTTCNLILTVFAYCQIFAITHQWISLDSLQNAVSALCEQFKGIKNAKLRAKRGKFEFNQATICQKIKGKYGALLCEPEV